MPDGRRDDPADRHSRSECSPLSPCGGLQMSWSTPPAWLSGPWDAASRAPAACGCGRASSPKSMDLSPSPALASPESQVTVISSTRPKIVDSEAILGSATSATDQRSGADLHVQCLCESPATDLRGAVARGLKRLQRRCALFGSTQWWSRLVVRTGLAPRPVPHKTSPASELPWSFLLRGTSSGRCDPEVRPEGEGYKSLIRSCFFLSALPLRSESVLWRRSGSS